MTSPSPDQQNSAVFSRSGQLRKKATGKPYVGGESSSASVEAELPAFQSGYAIATKCVLCLS